ncbi:MAG: phosphoglucomutase/phosphomannomutase family protein [Bacteroidia bacterium]|nr:phosphoglucomutase/phosphomannomutase family protein [Bacteroidia bacterium]NNC85425.1 phosphoglucomutase/phosphomannomutase family protein [Bacteroidia bacterium]NNM16275.1 phosphoglucomutase/phosphomannomutase family protein [Bacteroidia bacterium]
MIPIKFGTDGWRAIIAKEFTVDNVIRVSEASAGWLLNKIEKPKVVVGHDCRFQGKLFAETVTKVLCNKGIKVFLAKGFVSTPMISMAANKYGAELGIDLTASHNPPEYHGFKLKGQFGGPLFPAHVAEIEAMIKPTPETNIDALSLDKFEKDGLIEYVDLETMYCDEIEKNFDLEAIKKSGLTFAYDAMYGAGQNVIRRLLPDTVLLHCEDNPSFMGQAPEPIHRNLIEFSELIKSRGDIACGLATDGDADRLGLYDSKGNFVDSHHCILLLIHYLHKYKGMSGKVCTAFSTTPRVKKMCDAYGLEQQTVKIGFKYICEIMVAEDVLVGGEESGGIAMTGHIPERDGIWVGLVLWEFMAKSGKTLEDLIKEVYEVVGEFAFERSDLRLEESVKNKIVEDCKNNAFTKFGSYEIKRIDDLDGYKYFFDNDEWLMIRPSGTEPVLRTYAESSTTEGAFKILEAGKEAMLS